ncbi:unnamed protein product [Ectocarpus sp. CCAP 1310/34]|nr:unnamed protein product [Ectocarpus sp. CCAP 1310/34]
MPGVEPPTSSGLRRSWSSGIRTPRLSQDDLPTPTTTSKGDPCCLAWDLHEAAATRGGDEAVRRWCLGGGDPGLDQWGNSALHIASHKGHVETVSVLLHYQAQIDQRNRGQETPLHLACRHSHASVVCLLLENGADPRSEDVCGRTPFDLCRDQEPGNQIADLLRRSEQLKELGSLKRRVHIQVCHDNMSGVDKLLEVGGSIDARDTAQRTLLHRACEEASIATVSRLLELGATVNATEKRKQTPLHRACERGRLDIVRLLVEKAGADSRARAKVMHEPLHVACLGNWGQVVKFLLNEGNVDIEAADKNGMRSLHLAVQRNRLEAIRELLKHGCGDQDRATTTHMTCDNNVGRGNLIRRCDVEATMPDGLTRPLHMACASGYEKAATLLLDHHADIGAIGPKGHRPLHLAAKEERAVIVELLIGRKADLHAKDDRGRDALHYTDSRRCKERIQEAQRREERAAEAQRQLALQKKRDEENRRREQELLDRVDLRARARR